MTRVAACAELPLPTSAGAPMNRRMTVRPPLVSGVVLAAGSARRMNGGKLLLEIGGKPIVRAVVDEVLGAGLFDVIVVVNAANAAGMRGALTPLTPRLLVNPRAEEGIGASIAVGAWAVPPEADAFVLVQADQPLVRAAMLRALVREWQASAAAFVASRFGDVVTTPVLFGRALFAELRELSGDRGARSVLDRHRDRGAIVSFADWRGADVDTPEDYRRVRALWAGGAAAQSEGE
jgi:molybdenum cofactor cytidylyltransferase